MKTKEHSWSCLAEFLEWEIFQTKLLNEIKTDFHEIWYLNIFRNSVEKIQVSLKSDNNDGYFTWRAIHIFDHISLISS